MYNYQDLDLDQMRKEITRRKKSYSGKHLRSELIRILCEDDLEKIILDHIDYNDESDPTGELRRDQNLKEYEARCSIYKIRDGSKLKYHEDQVSKQKNATREARSKLDDEYAVLKSMHDLHVRNLASLQQTSVNCSAQQQQQQPENIIEGLKNISNDCPDLKPTLVDAPINIDQYYNKPCITIASTEYEVRGDRIPGLRKITSGYGARHVRCDPIKYIVTFGTNQVALQSAKDCAYWLRHKSELFRLLPLAQKPYIPVFSKGEEYNSRGPIQKSVDREDSKSGTAQSINTKKQIEEHVGGAKTEDVRVPQEVPLKPFESNDLQTSPTTKPLVETDLDIADAKAGASSTQLAKVPKHRLSSSVSLDFPDAKKPWAEQNKFQGQVSSHVVAPGLQRPAKLQDVTNKTMPNTYSDKLSKSKPPISRVPDQEFGSDSPCLVLCHTQYPIVEDTYRHLVKFIESRERKDGWTFKVEDGWDGLRVKFKTGYLGQKLAYLCWKEMNGKLLHGIPADFEMEEIDETTIEQGILEERTANLKAQLKRRLPGDSGIVDYAVRPTLGDHPSLFLRAVKKKVAPSELTIFWNTICNNKPDEVGVYVKWIKVDVEGLFVCFERTVHGQQAAASCPLVCFKTGWRKFKPVDFKVSAGVIA